MVNRWHCYCLKNNLALVCFGEKQQKLLEGKGVSQIYNLSLAGDLGEAAKNYFNIMRLIDSSQASEILCLELPEEGLGATVNDRLRKAQHQ